MPVPRVSVIGIFYNEQRFIGEAIESVLAQDFTDFELLLVDDGSTDGSSAIALDYAERLPGRVRYLEHPGHANCGTSATRNLGLAHARGDLIAYFDLDDIWRQSKLREQVAILDGLPEAGMVCGRVNYWSSWQGGQDRLVQTGHLRDSLSWPPETLLQLYPLSTGDAPTPSDVLVRRNVVEVAGHWEEDFPGFYDDQAFFSKIYLVAPVFFSTSLWLNYRQHEESCCATISQEEYARIRRRFLDWFADYLDPLDLPGKAAVAKAIHRERWKLDHPRTSRTIGRLQRLVRRLTGI